MRRTEEIALEFKPDSSASRVECEYRVWRAVVGLIVLRLM
jgi:hypothetical protein